MRSAVSFGACTLDLATRTLSRDGKSLPLTTGEFALLKALVSHPRQPLSRDRLMELARGRDHEAFDRSIDVQVSRLRKLIEADAAKPRYHPDGVGPRLCLRAGRRPKMRPVRAPWARALFSADRHA